jgi:phage-related protein
MGMLYDQPVVKVGRYLGERRVQQRETAAKKTGQLYQKGYIPLRGVPRWTIEVTPVAERELQGLPDDLQARFVHVAEMLEDLGPERVGMPHVRPLGRKLWEMRLKGRDNIARAIYFTTTARRLVVVRVFVKKSQKTPHREIALAEQRMKEQHRG